MFAKGCTLSLRMNVVTLFFVRWSLHGVPGTCKAHLDEILKVELLETVLRWNLGVEFQIAALQAVTVDLLSGDTVHHAFGLQASGKTNRAHRCRHAEPHGHREANSAIALVNS